MLYVASFCSCLKQTDEVYVEWLTELLRHVGKVWSKHLEYSAAHMPVSKSLLTTAAARGRVRHCSALDTAGSGAHLSFSTVHWTTVGPIWFVCLRQKLHTTGEALLPAYREQIERLLTTKCAD